MTLPHFRQSTISKFQLSAELFVTAPSAKLRPETLPAFVKNNPDARQHKLVIVSPSCAWAQQLFDDSLVAVYKLHGYAVLNLL